MQSHTKIRCTPRGLFSWRFELDGGGHMANTSYAFVAEQGGSEVDGVHFAVRKS